MTWARYAVGLSRIVLLVMTGTFLAHAGQFTTLKGYNYNSQSEFSMNLQQQNSVVVFMSTQCPCSNSHVDHLKKLSQQFNKFRFVAVHSNQNENRKEGLKYFKGKKLPFPILRDERAKIADQFGALKTPHAFVLSEKGDTIYSGPVTDSSDFSQSHRHYLSEFLVSLDSGQTFEPVKKRPLGCYISRSAP